MSKHTDELETIDTENRKLRTENKQLRQERDALKVEYESRAIWIAEMNKILGYDNSDGMYSGPDPFEIAMQLRQRVKELETMVKNECRDWAETDTYCKKAANTVLGDVEKDEPDFVAVEQVVDKLVQRVKELEAYPVPIAALGQLASQMDELDKQHDTIKQLTAMLEKVTCRGYDGPLYCTPDDPCVSCQFHNWQKGQTK